MLIQAHVLWSYVIVRDKILVPCFPSICFVILSQELPTPEESDFLDFYQHQALACLSKTGLKLGMWCLLITLKCLSKWFIFSWFFSVMAFSLFLINLNLRLVSHESNQDLVFIIHYKATLLPSEPLHDSFFKLQQCTFLLFVTRNKCMFKYKRHLSLLLWKFK